MEYKYHSIVLEHTDVGETDRLYALYTKEAGRIMLAANGVRKPQAKLAGNLESITLVEVFAAKNRGRGRITGAIAADNFSGLKENLPAIQKVFATLKIFSRLVTQEEQDAGIFALLLDYLKAMDTSGEQEEKIEILTAGFIFKLLSGLGYGLEMKKCVSCGA
ncbi:MAG: DNA repair protein RecO, partial [Candidatus Pacebacteria bacterium]|nr:DNA repair protein RecO [Candidatus Paceibacterota bacterium]